MRTEYFQEPSRLHLLERPKLSVLALLVSGFLCLLESPVEAAEEHSNEPYLYESINSRALFRTDATGLWVTEARIRVINEGGVQQLGQILFPYVQGRQSLSVEVARVHKADGSVLEVPSSSIRDEPAPFAAFFPVYSDLRLVHLLAPSIRPGDMLEYKVTLAEENPPAPGRFFLEHRFQRQAVVLEETFTLEVPVGLALELRYADELDFRDTESGGTRALEWRGSNPQTESLSTELDLSELLPPPDIEVSSFASWAAVGDWYRDLAAGRTVAGPSIIDKVDTLLRGLESDEERVRALYNYVTREFRYLALELGVGAYQPNRATDVMKNGYGDCKDKHTLLEALLETAGFEAAPVLVSNTRRSSTEVPSPGQFDHLITAVKLDGGWRMFLDSTVQISPFGYLAPTLRGKKGLLIPKDRVAELVELPSVLPFDTLVEVHLEGSLDEQARLEARVGQRLRGDAELIYRAALLSLPTAEWQKLGETAHRTLAKLGEVIEPSFSGATDSDEPLEIAYTLTVDNYVELDKAIQKLEPMLPRISLPETPSADEETALEPLKIDGPLIQSGRYTVTLQPDFTARAPASIRLEEVFGEYQSSYQVVGNELIAERKLGLHRSRIEPDELEAYATFRQAIEKDEEQTFSLDLPAATQIKPKESNGIEALLAQGEEEIERESWEEAVPLFQRAVELDSEHPTAWNQLSRALSYSGNYEDGAEAARRQLEVDPEHRNARNYLGYALERLGDLEGAETAYREQLQRTPSNRYANRRLADLLTDQGRCKEAISHLEQAIESDTKDDERRLQLARCCLEAGETDKGLGLLKNFRDTTNDAYAVSKAAKVAFDERHLELALALYEQAAALEPDDPDFQILPGLTLEEVGHLAEAIAVYERIIEEFPSYGDTYERLVGIYLKQGQAAKAREILVAHLDADPNNVHAAMGLGALLGRERRCKEATAVLEPVVEAGSGPPQLFEIYGQCLFDLNRFEEAKKALATAIDMSPRSAWSHRTLGLILTREERYDEAILHLEKAKELAPGLFDLQDMLDYAREQAGG